MGAAPTKEPAMGIMDFVKGGVRELMIVRPDDAKQLLIYKYPNQSVPTYAQLTVGNDDSAVFFKDGKHVGSLPPGLHTLHTQNFSFLNQVLTSITGGYVFLTDIFFVKLSQVRGVAIGGALAPMDDPVLAVRATPRVFGEFSFQVVDPARFVSGCCGQVAGNMNNDQLLNWVKAKFTLSLQATMCELCSQGQRSLLNLPAMTRDINARMMQRAPHLQEIGVTAVDVNLANVSFSPEDTQLLIDANKKHAAAARVVDIFSDAARARQADWDKKFQQEARNVQQLTGNWDNHAAGSATMGAGREVALGGAPRFGAQMAPDAATMNSMQTQPPVAPPAASPFTSVKMTCPACHASVPVGKFCPECGAPAT